MNISLLSWYCGKKFKKLQKVAWVAFELGIASYNGGQTPVTLTNEPLRELVTVADQAYLGNVADRRVIL